MLAPILDKLSDFSDVMNDDMNTTRTDGSVLWPLQAFRFVLTRFRFHRVV